MIIGIDPSITHTGIAAIFDDKKIFMLEEIKPPAKKLMKERLRYLVTAINHKILLCERAEPIVKIIIEQPPFYIASYGGRKSARRIITFSFSFGAIVAACYFGVSDDIIECKLARHKSGNKWIGCQTKAAAFNIVKYEFKDLKDNVDLKKYKGEKEKKLYNMTDALMLAWYAWDTLRLERMKNEG